MVDIGNLGGEIFKSYSSLISILPAYWQLFVNLFLVIVLMLIYSIFVWKLYRFLARKNIFELNLNQYNHSEHPILAKSLAVIFYFIEYILIMPLLIFVWFSVFTLFLIFLTENLELKTLLLISAAIIATVRMTAYYHEDLSKDIAKLFPFTLLAVSVLNPTFFSVERIFNQFQQLPAFFHDISTYLVFIIGLEIILRVFESIFSMFRTQEEKEELIKEEG